MMNMTNANTSTLTSGAPSPQSKNAASSHQNNNTIAAGKQVNKQQTTISFEKPNGVPRTLMNSFDNLQISDNGPHLSTNPATPSSVNRHEYSGVIITDVWADNLEKEMEYIIKLVEKYPYIAMDTEFPGVVVKPVGNFRSSSEYHYQTLKCNVNLLKIIQLGLTFADKSGSLPKDGRCTWQFHFKFNLKEDIYAQDSIELLTNSGIDFKKHQEQGIDVNTFGALLISSGIVLSDEVRWISFHSAYDYGYLLKLLTNSDLPNSEPEFFDLLHTYFPYIYDIKYLMKSCESLKGGLNQLADDLNIQRIGPAHQAGSDSLLTLHTFFKMMQLFFENNFDDEKFLGILYGLGQGFEANPASSHYSTFNPQNLSNGNIHNEQYLPPGVSYSNTSPQPKSPITTNNATSLSHQSSLYKGYQSPSNY